MGERGKVSGCETASDVWKEGRREGAWEEREREGGKEGGKDMQGEAIERERDQSLDRSSSTSTAAVLPRCKGVGYGTGSRAYSAGSRD